LVEEAKEYKENAVELKEEAEKYNSALSSFLSFGFIIPIILIIIFVKFFL
jgi:hypothetical protein